jgi:outer membrane receptor for ferrienterochelin and colicins
MTKSSARSFRPALSLAVAFTVVHATATAHAQDGYQSVVTGTRNDAPLSDVPVATEVIGREELEASGADNVAEALETHAGIEVESGLAGQVIVVQGLDPKYTLVLIDGERVIGRIGGGLDLSRIPISDVERIEIVKGPASALYGSDALGGVVNIITRRGKKKFEAEALSSYGSFGELESRARVADGWGPLRMAVSGGYTQGDGYDLNPETPATSAAAYDSQHANLELGWRPSSPSWRVDSSLRWMERDSRAVDESFSGAIFDRRNLTETIDATLAPEWKPTLATRLRLSSHFGYFRDQFVHDQRLSDEQDSYQDTRERLFESSLQFDWLLGDHLATAGADGMFEHLRTPRLNTSLATRTRGAVFVQDEWRIVREPALVAVPALRIDQDSNFGTHVTPHLSMRFDPAANVVLRASVGAGYRAPDFKEMYIHFENLGVGYLVDGNPDLQPETSRSVTLGSEWKPHERVSLSAGLYRHDLDDVILAGVVHEGTNSEDPTKYTYINVAEATSQGAELSLRVTPLQSLRLEASYAYNDAHDDDGVRKQLQGRPRHRATFSALFKPTSLKLELSARGSVVGRRRYDDYDAMGQPFDIYAPRYTEIDVRAAYRFLSRIAVFAGVDNALDSGNSDFSSVPPRAFYAGASGTY